METFTKSHLFNSYSATGVRNVARDLADAVAGQVVSNQAILRVLEHKVYLPAF